MVHITPLCIRFWVRECPECSTLPFPRTPAARRGRCVLGWRKQSPPFTSTASATAVCFLSFCLNEALTDEILLKDIRPANILSRISGLDGMTEEEVLEALGEPRTTEVITIDGGSHHLPGAP